MFARDSIVYISYIIYLPTYIHIYIYISIHAWTQAYRYLSPGAGAASARRLLRPSASSALPFAGARRSVCMGSCRPQAGARRRRRDAAGLASGGLVRARARGMQIRSAGRQAGGGGGGGARAARGWARWARRRPVERHVAGTHPINAASE